MAPTDIYPPGGVPPVAGSHDWQLVAGGGSLTHGITGLQSLFSMPVGQDRSLCWLAHCVVIRTNLCTTVLQMNCGCVGIYDVCVDLHM